MQIMIVISYEGKELFIFRNLINPNEPKPKIWTDDKMLVRYADYDSY